MRRKWKKQSSPALTELVTILNIEVLLGGKPICSMGSKQSKIEAAYDFTRTSIIMGTTANVSNSITYEQYMVSTAKKIVHFGPVITFFAYVAREHCRHASFKIICHLVRLCTMAVLQLFPQLLFS